MVTNEGAEATERPLAGPAKPRGVRSFRELAVAILAFGMVVGFALGWISFRSPWAYETSPAALYDEKLVTSVFEKASSAVVEVRVSRAGAPFFESTGSGFLIDKSGHIVTNHHVVDGASNLSVKLFDGRSLTATKLGSSAADDLAVLRVDPAEVSDIDHLKLADTDLLKPGELAIAIGSPFRHLNSVSVGVVSGVGRSQPRPRSEGVQPLVLRRPVADLVQTTAALNFGSSGGPLLNSSGEVIGVNSAVRVATPIQNGVGFAVSSNTLRSLLPELMSPGEIKRPWLGISGAALSKNLSATLGLPIKKGIYVRSVWPDSPAQRARIRPDNSRLPSGGGDVIVAVDGVEVGSVSEMVIHLNTLRPGDQVVLTIFRNDETQKVDVTLDEWPDT